MSLESQKDGQNGPDLSQKITPRELLSTLEKRHRLFKVVSEWFQGEHAADLKLLDESAAEAANNGYTGIYNLFQGIKEAYAKGHELDSFSEGPLANYPEVQGKPRTAQEALLGLFQSLQNNGLLSAAVEESSDVVNDTSSYLNREEMNISSAVLFDAPKDVLVTGEVAHTVYDDIKQASASETATQPQINAELLLEKDEKRQALFELYPAVATLYNSQNERVWIDADGEKYLAIATLTSLIKRRDGEPVAKINLHSEIHFELKKWMEKRGDETLVKKLSPRCCAIREKDSVDFIYTLAERLQERDGQFILRTDNPGEEELLQELRRKSAVRMDTHKEIPPVEECSVQPPETEENSSISTVEDFSSKEVTEQVESSDSISEAAEGNNEETIIYDRISVVSLYQPSQNEVAGSNGHNKHGSEITHKRKKKNEVPPNNGSGQFEQSQPVNGKPRRLAHSRYTGPRTRQSPQRIDYLLSDSKARPIDPGYKETQRKIRQRKKEHENDKFGRDDS